MPVDGVASTGLGRYCSPRHRIACKSKNEGLKCVSMTWRAIWGLSLNGGCGGGDATGGRGLHSFPFQLNLSYSVHRIIQLNS